MREPTVLAAIEDELLLRTVSWFLREHGYRVLEASRADLLFEHFATTVPDLFLLDITSPTLPGPRLLEWLKADEPWRDMPVLIITAMPPEDETVRLLSLGAADFIGKPFRVRELLARIQVQLRLQQLLRDAREELKSARAELTRARTEAEHNRKLVDILHDVTGDLSPDEIYHLLVRRVARALEIARCSLVLARPGDTHGVVATAYENPGLRNLEVDLARYPEIQAALDSQEPVLIQDIRNDSLYTSVRESWELEGQEVEIRSIIALPFQLDFRQAGVFFMRTAADEPPLTPEDVAFAETVIKAAVSAVRKAQLIETTQADKARLEQLASTDPLTGLLNRRALMERLTAEIDRAARYEHELVLLMIDLDHFKLVNDTYGHMVGDDVLRELSQLLVNEVRTVDIVARYGGEEFVVVLPEQPIEGGTAFAERVRERVAETAFGASDVPGGVRTTISVGIAGYPMDQTTTAGELIARADEALYRAKAAGRDRVHA
jgi:two-component system cell cycle response regulator